MKTVLLINKNSSDNPQFKQILFDKLIERLKHFNFMMINTHGHWLQD